jgi:hypothetical protein
MKDLPDYTTQVILRYEGGFIGLEELAARLGAVPPWNLRGNLVFMDGFEAELTDWHDEGTVAGMITRTTRHKFSGDWSVKLSISISESTNYGVIRRYFHYPGDGKQALFMRLGWDDDLQIFLVRGNLYTGSRELVFELGYNLETGELVVLTTGDTYYPVATGLYRGVGEVVFFPILLEFDTENEVYGTLYFADKQYDLSSVPLMAGDSSSRPQATLDIFPYGETAENTFDIYLDCVAWTKNIA